MSVKRTDRDLNKLRDDFKESVQKRIRHCEMEGVPIFVTEAYRSQERQNYLYQQGRTRSGPKITRTLNSKHTEGVAVDIASSGSSLYPDSRNWRRKVADIAKEYDIDRGYDLWKRDKPHFQQGEKKISVDKSVSKYFVPLTKIFSLFWKKLDKYSERKEIREIQSLLHDLNTAIKNLMAKMK